MSQTKPFDVERLAYLSDEAFVHHCFVHAFRRVCNPSLAKHYITALGDGAARADVARNIFQEDEYTHQIGTAALGKLLSLDGDQFLHEAYKTILLRPIDESGLTHYLKRLQKGEKKARILYDLATSTEGQSRRADHPELNDFLQYLVRKGALHRPIQLKDIVALLTSNDNEFVAKAYRLVLMREADSEGFAAYQQALLNGLSRIEVLYSLAYSSEGQNFRKTFLVRLCLTLGRLIWWASRKVSLFKKRPFFEVPFK